MARSLRTNDVARSKRGDAGRRRARGRSVPGPRAELVRVVRAPRVHVEASRRGAGGAFALRRRRVTLRRRVLAVPLPSLGDDHRGCLALAAAATARGMPRALRRAPRWPPSGSTWSRRTRPPGRPAPGRAPRRLRRAPRHPEPTCASHPRRRPSRTPRGSETIAFVRAFRSYARSRDRRKKRRHETPNGSSRDVRLRRDVRRRSVRRPPRPPRRRRRPRLRRSSPAGARCASATAPRRGRALRPRAHTAPAGCLPSRTARRAT